MSNQLPEGYKQTEIGVIPEDWNPVLISDLTSEVGDGIHATPVYSSSGDYYFVNGNNLIDGKIVVSEDTKKADLSQFKKYKKTLSDRTILLSINGTIGNLVFYRDELIILGKSAAYLNIRKGFSKQYIYFILQTKSVEQSFEDGLTGTTIRNLGLGTIRNTPIAVPKDYKEQRAIAQALSDVDALISALDKLIAKKRDLKTATMQQLLTGKKRLPGFGEGQGYKESAIGLIPEDWEVIKLADILKIRHGKSQRDVVDPNGTYPILGTGGEMGKTNIPLYREPSVLIGRKGTIDIPRYMDTPFWTVDTLFYSEIFKNTDAKFVFYKFNLIDWYSYNEASGVPSLNAATIENIEQALPILKEEQRAIALVLSDMDNAISALESRQAKTQAIKQGMMQELLTGRTRLGSVDILIKWGKTIKISYEYKAKR